MTQLIKLNFEIVTYSKGNAYCIIEPSGMTFGVVNDRVRSRLFIPGVVPSLVTEKSILLGLNYGSPPSKNVASAEI